LKTDQKTDLIESDPTAVD